MKRKNSLSSVRNAKDFIALSAREKSRFFEIKLKDEDKRSLTEALARTMESNFEEGGGLTHKKGLKPEFLRNQYHINHVLSHEFLDLLVKMARDEQTLANIFDERTRELCHSMFGLSSVLIEGGTLALAIRDKLTLKSTWEIIQLMAANNDTYQDIMDSLKAMAKQPGYDPRPNDHRMFDTLTELGMENPTGAVSFLEFMERYMLCFHLHPHSDGFSAADLRYIGNIQRPGVIIVPSTDLKWVEIHLAEPDERDNQTARDFGVVHAFKPHIELPQQKAGKEITIERSIVEKHKRYLSLLGYQGEPLEW